MKRAKERKEKGQKLTFQETIRNDCYALKLGFSIEKSMVIHSFFVQASGYFEWVFFEAVFLRHIVDALDRNQDFQVVFRFILLCGAMFFLLSVYENYVENVVYPLSAVRLHYGVYSKLYAKAKNVELRCYEDSEFYNRYTMSMDNSDTRILEIIRNVWGVLGGTAATIAVFWFMYEIDHYAVLFILSPLIGNFVFGHFKNKYEFKRYTEQAPDDKVLNYVNRVMYLPDYAKEIRLSNVFSLLKRQYRDATQHKVRTAVKYAFSNASLSFLKITFTFTVIFEGVLLYAIYRNRVTGSISLAQLTVMSSLMVAMTWILIGLFENIMSIMKNGMFISNLRGFMAYEEKIPEDQDGVMPEGKFETLEFDHVSFSYKEEETIKDLSFTIKEGEIAALVGHNGAGKTTIIKLLLRLYDPVSGVIRLNGRDIREYNLHAYRELFAVTFQDFSIFGLTVMENVLMGRHGENDEQVAADALKKAGMYDKVMSLPNGMHTVMTKEFDADGAVFSGGESQKIAVARTFAKDSYIKIFDEPSSALDPIAEYELFQNIMKEGSDHTMFFISHRLSSVKKCDKVFMLEGGRLIEEGSHTELMAQNGSYAKMYRRQAMNYLALDTDEEVAN
ncbi:MAG: ABC transporter ATP-binding protein/permease [Lachnospiraceae bacterium]|nr:ABC transporter ATP-binding protein/permease [Lachnospiraceae bacterium]